MDEFPDACLPIVCKSKSTDRLKELDTVHLGQPKLEERIGLTSRSRDI
jgi:hypothetical protein